LKVPASIEIVEYGSPVPAVTELANIAGVELGAAEKIIREAGERVRRLHGLKNNPIEITDRGVIAAGIAGVISLTSDVDLEIRPKYAASGVAWREDLLFLSLFTTYGYLDPLRSISASVSSQNTLADLAARALIGMIGENRRTPLRIRSRLTFESFEISTEVDPDDLLNPGEDGWRQVSYAMNPDNEFAATIVAGAAALSPLMRDEAIRATLAMIVARFGKIRVQPSGRHRQLPPRLSKWQKAYDFAFQLARNRSLSPRSGTLGTFGFTLDTWRTWESLIERSLILALGASNVDLQRPFKLGTSTRPGRPSLVIDVYPDAIINRDSVPLIFDAKYKGRSDRGFEGVSPSDRYEAMAFMHATSSTHATLIYPNTGESRACGSTALLETVELPTGTVKGTSIEINGISEFGGLSRFAHGLKGLVDVPQCLTGAIEVL